MIFELSWSKNTVSGFPFEVSGQNERSMVNVYFHIVVEYSDQYKVLSAGDCPSPQRW